MSYELTNPKDIIDQQQFIRLLYERFPEIVAEIDSDDLELLHMVMAAVSHATSEAIDAGDWGSVSSHYSFVSMVFSRADSAVENAVIVSYLENILLGEDGAKHLHARSLLPDNLEKALVGLEAHFERLEKGV